MSLKGVSPPSDLGRGHVSLAQEKQVPIPVCLHQSPTPGHLCGLFPISPPQWQGHCLTSCFPLWGRFLRHHEARITVGACRFNDWSESLPLLDMHPLAMASPVGGQCSPAFCPWAWSRELPWTSRLEMCLRDLTGPSCAIVITVTSTCLAHLLVQRG